MDGALVGTVAIKHAQFLGRIAAAMRRKKKAAARSKAINPSNNLG
jgi:hypothetical protein